MRFKNDTLIDVTRQETGGKLWRPIRVIQKVEPNDDAVTRLQSQVNPAQPAGTTTQIVPGIPYQLLSISATESPSKQQDRTYSQVSVSFTRDGGDPAYGFTRIYLKGYKGNTGRVLQTEGRESPITFLLETTGETITVLGVPVGLDGTPASIELAKSTTVLLDGVISAPPAPTVSQSLIASPTGYQFTFTQLAAQAADIIDCYKIYRNTANSSGSATVIRTVKHDPKNASAPVVIQDTATGGVLYYYWVSAVNTVGLESTLTAAQSGAVYTGGRGQQILARGAIKAVSASLSSGVTTTASYTAANSISLPGAFETWVYSSSSDGLVDILLWASDTSSKPNGYFFRFDNRASQCAGQLLKVTAGAWGAALGTQLQSTNGTRLATGWYKLRGEWAADGVINIYINDVWHATAVDTTYTPTGAVYYGYELVSSQITNDGGSSSLNSQGSLATITGLTLSYTSNDNSITWSWTSGTIYNLDGSTVSVGASSFAAFTGLSMSTTYYFGAYYDLATAAVVIVKSSTSSGTAPLSLAQLAQTINADGHVPLRINFTGATQASGGSGGGGSGGSDEVCFSGNTRIVTKRGVVPFSEVTPGDEVFTAVDTWRRVIAVTSRAYTGRMVDMGAGELVTPGHLFKSARGKWRRAVDVLKAKSFAWSGDVWNLHVEADSFDEHSYTLGNGHKAHNNICA
jgi:hypothetical protein